jgi:hypothetical protein
VRPGKGLWTKFRKNVTAAGLTVSGLAAEMGHHRQLFVNQLQRGQGIGKARAQEIERLIGWPVSQWPHISQPRPVKRKARC